MCAQLRAHAHNCISTTLQLALSQATDMVKAEGTVPAVHISGNGVDSSTNLLR